LISDAATGFYAIPAIKFVEGRSRIFHIVIAFVAVGMIAADFLVAGALLFAPDLEAVISHETNKKSQGHQPVQITIACWLSRHPCRTRQFVSAFCPELTIPGT
jgi:hypothetical protein